MELSYTHESVRLTGRWNLPLTSKVSFVGVQVEIPEPLHPLRDGHSTVARNLIPLLRDIIGSRA